MRKILNIFKEDLRNIFKNKVALIVIISLAIIPSLYAWFNIIASWNPYGNTSNLEIAIVNNDVGCTLSDTYINAGKTVIDELKNNKDLGWQFVDENLATKGVEIGDYYASIIIPKDFSKNLTSLLEDNPKKAELIYTINEKLNAVAPKITDKGAETLQKKISESFIKSADGAIFKIFNTLGINLNENIVKIEDYEDLIFKLEEKLPEINTIVKEADSGLSQATDLTNKARNALPVVESILNDTSLYSNKLNEFLDKLDTSLDGISPAVKGDLILLDGVCKDINSITNNILANKDDIATVKALLLDLKTKVESGITIVNNIETFFTNLNNYLPNHPFDKVISTVNNIKNNMTLIKSLVDDALDAINNSEKPAIDILEKINQLSSNISKVLDDIIASYDAFIIPSIDKGLLDIKNTLGNVEAVLLNMKNDIPEMKSLLEKLANGETIARNELPKILEKLPGMEDDLKNIAEKIREFNSKFTLGEISKILSTDSNVAAEFFGSPVAIKENRIYPVENYGAAMTPFYTTLCLWVGGLLLSSILTVEAKAFHENKEYKMHHVYFGKLFTYLSVGIFQGLIVSIGDIYLLKVQMTNPGLFILNNILTSIVFVTMLYTLVSLLGNIGKVIGIILLVLQVAGSGGTFPIQLLPDFFKVLQPLLPFTYSIGISREAIAGIATSVVIKDFLILSIFLVLSILIGGFFKKFLSKYVDAFNRKLKESNLTE